MTVIVAFGSPSRNRSAICADDLAVGSQRQADKVTLVFERYAVGIIGCDFLKLAVEAVGYFGPNVKLATGRAALASIPDTRTLCDHVASLVPRLSKAYLQELDECVGNELITQEQREQYASQGGSLVILDTASHALEVARLPYSAIQAADRTHVAFEFEPLESETVYHCSKHAAPLGIIPPPAFEAFPDWAKHEIATFAAEHNPRAASPQIGQLGAYLEVVDGTFRRASAFESYHALLTAHGCPRRVEQ
jgi:hypothetical protein